MTPELFSLAQRIHGHLAILGLAVLIHPIVWLRGGWRFSPRAQWTTDIGAILLTVSFSMGWWLYPSYREHIKPGLMAEQLNTALRFESKEHLAAIAVALLLSSALTLRFGRQHKQGLRLAHTLLTLGWAAAMITFVLGTYVAHVAHPAW